jgi:hypothetical protein
VQSSRTRASARFIFISDGQPSSSWRDTRLAAPNRVAWRVLAANNRPLGRSAIAFDSYPDAVADALRLGASVDQLSAGIALGPAREHWIWQLTSTERPVACCVHEYKRRIECARSLEQFLVAVRTADPTTAELRHFGLNALRIYGGYHNQAIGCTGMRLAVR